MIRLCGSQAMQEKADDARSIAQGAKNAPYMVWRVETG